MSKIVKDVALPGFEPPAKEENCSKKDPLEYGDAHRDSKEIAADLVKDINGYAEDQFSEPFRTRLGASIIGDDCAARLWLGFRWTVPNEPKGELLRLFKRGEREEPWLISLLEGIGCKVTFPEKPVSYHDGHFGGRGDFVIELPEKYKEKYGINEAVIGECKTSATGHPFNKLSKGLDVVQPKHKAQNDVYGVALGFNYGLYISTNKNDDKLFIELREIDKKHGNRMIAKAGEVVYSQCLPSKISDDPSFGYCKGCTYRQVCQYNKQPVKNCRSCVNASPGPNGTWLCALAPENDNAIPKDFIKIGCDAWHPIING